MTVSGPATVPPAGQSPLPATSGRVLLANVTPVTLPPVMLNVIPVILPPYRHLTPPPNASRRNPAFEAMMFMPDMFGRRPVKLSYSMLIGVRTTPLLTPIGDEQAVMLPAVTVPCVIPLVLLSVVAAVSVSDTVHMVLPFIVSLPVAVIGPLELNLMPLEAWAVEAAMASKPTTTNSIRAILRIVDPLYRMDVSTTEFTAQIRGDSDTTDSELRPPPFVCCSAMHRSRCRDARAVQAQALAIRTPRRPTTKAIIQKRLLSATILVVCRVWRASGLEDAEPLAGAGLRAT